MKQDGAGLCCRRWHVAGSRRFVSETRLKIFPGWQQQAPNVTMGLGQAAAYPRGMAGGMAGAGAGAAGAQYGAQLQQQQRMRQLMAQQHSQQQGHQHLQRHQYQPPY